MSKKDKFPVTRVKNIEPKTRNEDWIVWAAWADRITFEEIYEKTGQKENEVIQIMRRNMKPRSFKLWRKRVATKSIKHRKLFMYKRKKLDKNFIE